MDVKTACDMLGFDPLYLANEGKVVVILPEDKSGEALAILRDQTYGKLAARIGTVAQENPTNVLLETGFGSTRILDMLSGEILPRIC